MHCKKFVKLLVPFLLSNSAMIKLYLSTLFYFPPCLALMTLTYSFFLLTPELYLAGATVFTLLPGSRLQEVTRILPIFLKTIELLKNSFSELSIFIPVAPNSHVEDFVSRTIQSSPLSAILVPGASLDQKYDAFSVWLINFFFA